MSNNNNPSSKRAFTTNEICMHLIADCKPAYKKTVANNYSNRDYENSNYFVNDSREEERNCSYEQENNERAEREARVNQIHDKYGYSGIITDNEDLDVAEARASLNEVMTYYL